jgi:hypothetical protein
MGKPINNKCWNEHLVNLDMCIQKNINNLDICYITFKYDYYKCVNIQNKNKYTKLILVKM